LADYLELQAYKDLEENGMVKSYLKIVLIEESHEKLELE
jgi:hypothetical protein